MGNGARGRVEHKVAGGIELDAFGAFELEQDLAGIGAGLDDPVVFEGAGAAAVDQVDTGIDLAELDAGIVRDIGAPCGRVAALEVVASDGLEIEAFGTRGWIGADHAHADDVAAGLDDGFGRSEKENLAFGAGKELNSWIGLAGIHFKCDGKVVAERRTVRVRGSKMERAQGVEWRQR